MTVDVIAEQEFKQLVKVRSLIRIKFIFNQGIIYKSVKHIPKE